MYISFMIMNRNTYMLIYTYIWEDHKGDLDVNKMICSYVFIIVEGFIRLLLLPVKGKTAANLIDEIMVIEQWRSRRLQKQKKARFHKKVFLSTLQC